MVGPLHSDEMIMDFSMVFTTYEQFESRDALVKWVADTGKENGMVIVVKRSDSGDSGRLPRLFLACERSGQYREPKKKPSVEVIEKVNEESKVEGKKGKKHKKNYWDKEMWLSFSVESYPNLSRRTLVSGGGVRCA